MYIYHDAGPKQKIVYSLNCNFNMKRARVTEKDFCKVRAANVAPGARHPMVSRDGYVSAEEEKRRKE